MRTLVCTACGRFTSRYYDRCPFCKQRNLVMLDSYNASALSPDRLMRGNGAAEYSGWQSFLLVAALAGGLAAFMYIWIHPADPDKTKPAEGKLISAAPKPAASVNH